MKRRKSSEIAKENRREEGEDREGDSRKEIKKDENGEWKRKRRNQDVNL